MSSPRSKSSASKASTESIIEDPFDNVPGAKLEREIELGSPITDVSVFSYQLARHTSGEPVTSGFNFIDMTGRKLVFTPAGPDVVVKVDGTGEQLGVLRGHTTPVSAVDIITSTKRGPVFASASVGGTVRLWDAATGAPLRIAVPGDRTNILANFTGPDGWPRVASGGDDGIIRIWDPLFAPQTRIGHVLTRGFGDRVATTDLLNRGAFVAALTSALSPAADDEGPTVITVDGQWGSGKSTLLEFVRHALHTEPATVAKQRRFTVAAADWRLHRADKPAEAEPPVPDKPLVVTFNPWRHQSSEQVWAGLAKAVTQAAERVMLPHRNNQERYWFRRNAPRIDRRHTQRELWKRIRSPFLTVGVLGLGLSAVAQLTKLALPWPWLATAVFLGGGLLHTAWRYMFARASAFLPGELFTGPVLSNAFASKATDPMVRDPYYHAQSGYLYLVQHDVAELLKDLAAHGYQLVVLVDDLDRCTPRTTAEVFEAINVFLSDTLPRTRFVLGLDPTIVASHVDHAYRELADAKVVAHPDDPSPGWTFLRKLVQLPVRLPRTTADNVDRLLDAQLGPVHRDQVAQPVVTDLLVERLDESGRPDEATLLPTHELVEEIVVAIERDPAVRAHLHHRLTAQPEHSVREEKRLINIWQFYLRVLASNDIKQACHLVAVAEIVTRWPAYQHLLRNNWEELADTVDDDVAWGATIAKIGFKHADERAADNLRALLRDCDAKAVATLADLLL